MARFPFLIHIWLASRTTFATKRRIIDESRFKKNTSNFWSATMFRTISVSPGHGSLASWHQRLRIAAC